MKYSNYLASFRSPKVWILPKQVANALISLTEMLTARKLIILPLADVMPYRWGGEVDAPLKRQPAPDSQWDSSPYLSLSLWPGRSSIMSGTASKELPALCATGLLSGDAWHRGETTVNRQKAEKKSTGVLVSGSSSCEECYYKIPLSNIELTFTLTMRWVS